MTSLTILQAPHFFSALNSAHVVHWLSSSLANRFPLIPEFRMLSDEGSPPWNVHKHLLTCHILAGEKLCKWPWLLRSKKEIKTWSIWANTIPKKVVWGSIYTEHQRKYCNDASDSVLIVSNAAAWKWVATPIWSDSIVFSEKTVLLAPSQSCRSGSFTLRKGEISLDICRL